MDSAQEVIKKGLDVFTEEDMVVEEEPESTPEPPAEEVEEYQAGDESVSPEAADDLYDNSGGYEHTPDEPTPEPEQEEEPEPTPDNEEELVW